MKKIILIVYIIIGIIKVDDLKAQNLVPNCSFEDTIYCPAGSLGNISFCKDWYSAGTDHSSPDYFKDCGIYNSVPYNPIGFQYAATGNSYTGIIPWIKNELIQNQKEFIGTQLISPLVIGQHYYVSCKISFTVNLDYGYASNKTGILFSTKKYNNSNPAPIKNFAHIYTNKVIADTLNWIKISGWITADSVYKYISIGDFFDNSHTDTIRVYKSTYNDNGSYYYIDDVCVSLDSTKCSCITGDFVKENLHELLISAYYNTETGFIELKNLSSSNNNPAIYIYDLSGRLIYNSSLKNKQNKIATTNFIKGIYLINIQSNNTVYNYKFFIN